MRKSLVFLILACFVIVSCSDPVRVDSGSYGSIEVSKSSDVIEDLSIISSLKASISSDTQAVGLVRESLSSQVSKALVSEDSLGNVLVQRDSSEELPSEVMFSVVKNGENFDRHGRFRNPGEEIEQSELPGFIDKTYVLGNYTIVSFLAVDFDTLKNSASTIRKESPNGSHYSGDFDFRDAEDSFGFSNIEFSYDEGNDFFNISVSYKDPSMNGFSCDLSFRSPKNTHRVPNEPDNVTYFDTIDYCNSIFRKSYIIDNSTGLIYQLDDSMNVSVHQGILIDGKKGPLDIELDENGNLILKPIVKNPSLFIYDIFKDCYGQYYVLNDSIDEVDLSDGLSVVYYTQTASYIPAKDGSVVHITFNDSSTSRFFTQAIKKVSKVGASFVDEPFETDCTLELNYEGRVEESSLNEGLKSYNSYNGNDWKVVPNGGSFHVFDKIMDGKLLSYYVDGFSYAVFATTDIYTGDIEFIDYTCERDTNYYFAPDGRTLIIVSNKLNKNKSSYSIYAVYPFEDDEYRQHFYLEIMNSSGNVHRTPTYDEFKSKYYMAFKKANSDRYSPTELRAKYRIDLDGTSDWVEGWTNYEEISRSEEGVDSSTLKTVVYYYVWKPGYSDDVFKNMYYKYEYVDDGEYKLDLSQHTILENIVLDKSCFRNGLDFMNMSFETRTASGNAEYSIVKNSDTAEYEAVLFSFVTAQRDVIVLQPVNRAFR